MSAGVDATKPALPARAAVDALDGFSTTAVIRASFSAPLNPASLTGHSVIVLQVSIDNVLAAARIKTLAPPLGAEILERDGFYSVSPDFITVVAPGGTPLLPITSGGLCPALQ